MMLVCFEFSRMTFSDLLANKGQVAEGFLVEGAAVTELRRLPRDQTRRQRRGVLPRPFHGPSSCSGACLGGLG